MVNPPLPFMASASTNRTSPLGPLFDFAFRANFDPTQKLLDDLLRNHQLFSLTLSQPASLLAADGPNRPLQAAHTSLPRVVTNHIAQRRFGKFDLIGGNSVLFNLPGNEISIRNMQLLFLAVALQFDDLHTIAQRLGNWIEHVRGRNEQHLRQIKGHIEVVIAERRILLGIERFEQCRSRIAAEIAPHFVDFVEHENWIFRLRPANALNNLPRQSADVSAAVAPDFGFIMYAA